MRLKNLSKLKLMLLGSLLSLSAISCTHIPNGPGCVELSPRQGWCTMTLSPGEFYVDDQNLYEGMNWEELDATSVRIPASYWGKLKAEMIKSCKKNGNCPDGWEDKIDSIDDKINKAKLNWHRTQTK